MFCMKCGSEMPDSLNFCTNCGNDLSKSKQVLQGAPASANSASGSPAAGGRPVSQPFSASAQPGRHVATGSQAQFAQTASANAHYSNARSAARQQTASMPATQAQMNRAQGAYPQSGGGVSPVNPAMAAGRTASAPQPAASGEEKNITPIIIAIAAVVALVVAGILFFVVGGQDKNGTSSTSQNTELSGESEAVKQQSEEETEDEAKEPVASGAPRFVRVSCSSVLTGDVDSHQPDQATDGSTTTAWCEGESGNGEGEWLELQADTKQNVTSVTLMGGFCKSEDLYWKNSRPKDITITFDDGSKTTSTLSDEPFAWHTITLAKPVQTKTVRITIDSVYPGSRYTDTCISEVTVK